MWSVAEQNASGRAIWTCAAQPHACRRHSDRHGRRVRPDSRDSRARHGLGRGIGRLLDEMRPERPEDAVFGVCHEVRVHVSPLSVDSAHCVGIRDALSMPSCIGCSPRELEIHVLRSSQAHLRQTSPPRVDCHSGRSEAGAIESPP